MSTKKSDDMVKRGRVVALFWYLAELCLKQSLTLDLFFRAVRKWLDNGGDIWYNMSDVKSM